MAELIGVEQINRKLAILADPTKIKRAARAGLVAGQRVVVKGIKAAIPTRYKEVRKLVGQSVKRVRYGESAGSTAAKVGMAVGKKQISSEEAESVRRQRRAQGKSGVGISARNVHWLVLGTKFAKSKPLAGVVQAGFNASKADAAAKIATNIQGAVEREIGNRLQTIGLT